MVVNTVKRLEGTYYVANIYIESQQTRSGADAINISGLLV